MREPSRRQQALRPGDKFAVVRPELCTIEFGEITDTVDAHRRRVVVYRRDAPGPSRTQTRHIGDMSPLTDTEFDIAKAAQWDAFDRLPSTPEGRSVLVAVYTSPDWEPDGWEPPGDKPDPYTPPHVVEG